MFGYTGKLLFVDLTAGTTEVRELDEATAKNFIGGPSLGAKILYDEMPAHTDVFSEQA
jgi:aldehyde:ferredoxin oxidoreductase